MNDRPRQRQLFEDESVENNVTGREGTADQNRDEGSDPERLEGKHVYVVDAHSLIYQLFHARGDMSGPHGQAVGAIHGFLADIIRILTECKPDYLLSAFDPPGKTFRHDIYDQYKMNREPMPLDLRSQIPNIERFLLALGIPVFSVPGYEADDVLATVAWQVERLGGHCFLVTGDKDCCQLITDRVRMYNIRKAEIIDRAAVVRQWGIRPEQVVDLQALWGDATDNIPGIAGVGWKTASRLLARYETLEGVFQHVEEISGAKRRENIRAGEEAALMSRELVRLVRDVPLDISWNSARVGRIDGDQMLALCDEFGFRGLRDQVRALSGAAAPVNVQAAYETVDTEERLNELVDRLSQQTRIGVDTETTSTQARWADIVGFSFSWKPAHGVYVPVRAPAGDPALDPRRTIEALRPVFENERIEKVGQNLKYDLVVLRAAGVRMRNVAFDTMVADYLLEPGQRNHGLDDLANRYLNHQTIKISELIGRGKQQKRMDQVPVHLVTPYAAEDADLPLRLAGQLASRLREEAFETLFHELEMPLIDVLAELEFNGIKVDVPLLQRLSERYGRRLAELEAEIHAMAGGPFNIDSPKQLSRVLFGQLGLPVVKKTKTGPSTDADVLNQLGAIHPLPAKIIEYRQQAKLKNTYVDALPALVHPKTGRVHTSFKQDVAATGRLSSTDPNLQNIPVRTRDGREIRAAFVPGFSGWQLLCADYSQIELRVLAHFSGDKTLREAFEKNRDIHAQVASEIHGVPLGQVTGEMRRAAKAVNFGIIYGQSPFGLAKALSIDKSEAAAFIEAYFERYPAVDQFLGEILEACRKNGYVATALGRRRPIQGVRDSSLRHGTRQRNLPERIAINTVIQGTAADLIKQAMLRVHRRLQAERTQAQLLLQIHDELIFEVLAEQQAALADWVVEEMSAVGHLAVPLKVDVKVGRNWAECEPMSH
ncbi:MAG: DNA polymerase I [Planctomycetota bacterium]